MTVSDDDDDDADDDDGADADADAMAAAMRKNAGKEKMPPAAQGGNPLGNPWRGRLGPADRRAGKPRRPAAADRGAVSGMLGFRPGRQKTMARNMR